MFVQLHIVLNLLRMVAIFVYFFLKEQHPGYKKDDDESFDQFCVRCPYTYSCHVVPSIASSPPRKASAPPPCFRLKRIFTPKVECTGSKIYRSWVGNQLFIWYNNYLFGVLLFRKIMLIDIIIIIWQICILVIF